MAKFTYTAMDAKGSEKTGSLDANNQAEAINQLREKGLFPTNVVELDAGGKSAKSTGGPQALGVKKQGAKAAVKGGVNLNVSAIFGGSGVKTKALAIMTRQLATLVEAGLPLLKGLSVLTRQERNPILKTILGNLASDVESGSTFSEALFKHPKVFNKLYVNMVKAGEVGGVLEVVLGRLSQFMEKAEKIKSKVKAAMFYPVVVLIIAVVILGFLMIFIVPKFEQIFAEMLGGAALPMFTQVVLGISRALQKNIILIVIVLVLMALGIKFYSKTVDGRRNIDKLKLNAPLVGDLTRKSAIARFTRTLGTLVSSGVPILQALLIVRETSGNVVVAEAIGKVHDSVKEGESIVQPLEACGVFPPMVISMVDVGETTGALPDMLMKIADNYEDEVDNAISAMVSLLEPIMIVFLAIVVGSIVIALFLPLISIIQNLSNEASGG